MIYCKLYLSKKAQNGQGTEKKGGQVLPGNIGQLIFREVIFWVGN